MPWNARGKSDLVAVVLLCGALIGCRASVERGAPATAPQTIVVRESSAAPEQRGYDSGERGPNRIEVVVSDPRDGGGPPALGQLVGRSVKVQFRRDALGLSATSNAPVPITGQGPGGRAVSINGTVRSATGGWIVLEREKVSYWIPQAAILLIETSDSPTTAPTSD